MLWATLWGNVHFSLLMASQLAGLSHWPIWRTISRVPDVSLCLGNYNYLRNFKKNASSLVAERT